MMAGPDGDSFAIEQLGHVVRMDAIDREADDRAAVFDRRTEDLESFDLGQLLVGRTVRSCSCAAMASKPIDWT